MVDCKDCIHDGVCFMQQVCDIEEQIAEFGCDDFKCISALWIINGEWGECSHCHEVSKLSVMEHKDYCPACGAIMDEESVVIHP